MVTPVKLPTIRPPTSQDKFDSVSGYEWADRITSFLKLLTDTLDQIINNPVNPPGFSSPLTTKGDIWGFTTVNARIPVGTPGQVPTADPTSPTGITYKTPASSVILKDEGTVLGPITTLNAVGPTITASISGTDGTLTVVGGGGGTLQSQEFTTSGTFTWPAGVTSAWVSMIGGGCGGMGALAASNNPGAGGGSGEYVMGFPVPKQGATVAVTVGAGGAGGAVATRGGSGADTSFGSYIIVRGAPQPVDTTHSGAGGGVTGAPSRAIGSIPGTLGSQASPLHFGGSSAGGVTNLGGVQNGGAGGGTGGYLVGGAGGIGIAGPQSGGGGGGASPWGIGGAGGGGNTAGSAAPATSYGAGGGGGGGAAGGTTGGKGADGYCLVVWVG